MQVLHEQVVSKCVFLKRHFSERERERRRRRRLGEEKDCNKDILGIELNSVKGFFGVNGWACFGREKLCLLGIFQKHIFLSLSSSFSMVFCVG
jgi:hypothetical protein